MVKIARQNDNAVALESESFGNYVSEYSIEEMLQDGLLVKVTAWVVPEMGLGTNGVRVNAAITAKLWRTIVSVPTFCQSWQSIRGRGYEVMWIAAWALRLARERGVDLARFCVFLPTADDDEMAEKALRVETCRQANRNWVVIGLCDEFSIGL